MLDGAEYSSSAECLGALSTITKKKKSKLNKRRFSDEQIRSLEVMFESETKLEPKKKVQLARELGLQPRQVAIWFQNKRARWKSKHIEKEYSMLLASYNNLASQFESLKKEKQCLLTQLQKLKNERMGGCDEEGGIQERGAGNSSTDGESDYPKIEFEVKDIGSRSCLEGMQLSSDDDCSINAGLLGLDEENELLRMVEVPAAAGGDSSLTSAEDWGSLDSEDMINQASDESFQWWDFWS